MKNRNIYLAVALAVTPVLTGCLDEAFPESDRMSTGQVANASKAAIAAAIPAYMIDFTDYYDTSDGGDPSDIGFPAFGIYRDTMVADMALYEDGYDYFTNYAVTQYLYDYAVQTRFWKRYYYLVRNCNAVIGTSSYSPDSEDAEYMGTALAYRAMAYLDMARMFEFFPTGVESLDQRAATLGIYGLTVPITTSETTEAESRVAKRAPFYEMYRFILTDLDNAEKVLANVSKPAVENYCGLGAVYGLKARLWLELGSRFTNYPDDLSTAVAQEESAELADLSKLGITSAKECFANAAVNARKVINLGYVPTTESQWYDPKTGFNSPTGGWIWDIIISANSPLCAEVDWQSWPGLMSPEAFYGIGNSTYGAYRCIDAKLYSMMDLNDWRRYTWIAPADAGNEDAYNNIYQSRTNLDFKKWKSYGAYAGFKYHPGGGNISAYTVGNAVSLPLMRVEEMYLIEAEALIYSQGVDRGRQALESFMNSYRMDAGKKYRCSGSSEEEVADAVTLQKRIELWAEGLIVWDFRRRRLAIERGYDGTNHIAKYRFNSYPGYVAPWTNICIPERVKQLNPSFPLNPDPSLAIPIWTE